MNGGYRKMGERLRTVRAQTDRRSPISFRSHWISFKHCDSAFFITGFPFISVSLFTESILLNDPKIPGPFLLSSLFFPFYNRINFFLFLFFIIYVYLYVRTVSFLETILRACARPIRPKYPPRILMKSRNLLW